MALVAAVVLLAVLGVAAVAVPEVEHQPAEALGHGGLQVENQPVFTAAFKTYADTPLGTVVIRNNELFNSGVRDSSNAEGIDNVNGDRMVVQDNHIHDIRGRHAMGITVYGTDPGRSTRTIRRTSSGAWSYSASVVSPRNRPFLRSAGSPAKRAG